MGLCLPALWLCVDVLAHAFSIADHHKLSNRAGFCVLCSGNDAISSLAYRFTPRLVSEANYLQWTLKEAAPGTFHEAEVHGIKIVVKQSGVCVCARALGVRGGSRLGYRRDVMWLCGAGNIGQFQVRQLLLSLVSSVALLAVAKIVVDFLAFNILPLKFIYGQYRVIDVSVWLPADGWGSELRCGCCGDCGVEHVNTRVGWRCRRWISLTSIPTIFGRSS
jgi:hypothetical protein